jgi:hypothetical protein
MKMLSIILGCSLALTVELLAQSPAASPQPPAPTSPPPGVVISPTVTASPSASPESDLERSIAKKHKRHFNFTIGDQDSDTELKGDGSHDDIPWLVVPIVAVVFLTIFGAPVLIVAVILYFGFSRNRMMHKTIRMMVEKGQEVPAALLAPPPPAQRQRSDMRRGVVLLMVGLGVTIFLGAVNDWEGGAWAIGIIPFLIGLGYLLVWKMEGKKDIPPPLP